jgi:predicted small integral membrane protein
MSVRISALSRLVLLTGLAAWLSIAVFNNLTDPGTNRLLLGHMLSMDLLRSEPVLGSGLAWHAWPTEHVPTLLYAVAAVQVTVAAAMWLAALLFARAGWSGKLRQLRQARSAGVLALSGFLLLWLWFACGGLWFGYWIKQGAVQSVHLTMILIALGALLYVQSAPVSEPQLHSA